jgi:tetratricopeptide (TPR) repeat protein
VVGVLAAVCLPLGAVAASSKLDSTQRITTHLRGDVRPACPSKVEIDVLLLAGSRAMQEGQYAKPIESLAPPLSSCDPRLGLLYSAALEASGDVTGAEEALRRSHREWPKDASLAASLARIYFLSGRIPEAGEALALTTATVTAPLQELELRTEVNLALHRLAAAESAAKIANRSYPSAATLLLLANVLQTQGRASDAYALLKAQRQANLDSVPFLITIAECEYDTGLLPSAYQDLQHADAIDPHSFQVHYLLGNTLVKLGRSEEGVPEYRLAIGLAGDKPMLYYQLALAQVMGGDIGEAEKNLSKAILVDDHFGLAYKEMGELLIEDKRFAEALDPLQKAIEYSPSVESSYYLLMRAYSRLGNKKKSDEILKAYLEVKAANRRRPAELNAEEQGRVPSPSAVSAKPQKTD